MGKDYSDIRFEDNLGVKMEVSSMVGSFIFQIFDKDDNESEMMEIGRAHV